jgi:hypothetical protein
VVSGCRRAANRNSDRMAARRALRVRMLLYLAAPELLATVVYGLRRLRDRHSGVSHRPNRVGADPASAHLTHADSTSDGRVEGNSIEAHGVHAPHEDASACESRRKQIVRAGVPVVVFCGIAAIAFWLSVCLYP